MLSVLKPSALYALSFDAGNLLPLSEAKRAAGWYPYLWCMAA